MHHNTHGYQFEPAPALCYTTGLTREVRSNAINGNPFRCERGTHGSDESRERMLRRRVHREIRDGVERSTGAINFRQHLGLLEQTDDVHDTPGDNHLASEPINDRLGLEHLHSEVSRVQDADNIDVDRRQVRFDPIPRRRYTAG